MSLPLVSTLRSSGKRLLSIHTSHCRCYSQVASSVFNHYAAAWPNQHVTSKSRLLTTMPDSSDTELLYEGPMSKMITTLKVFSLSSAALSTVGLPALMLFRGMDVFNTVHMMMIGTTMFGSIGSTVGLHFIFSPYVYTLERIPVRKCHYKGAPGDIAVNDNASDEVEDSSEQSNQQEASSGHKPEFLLKATTKSILATTVEHVFNPETDVKGPPPGTIRPFCSFIVKGTTPLFIHEQMIQDQKLSQHLFIDNAEPIKKQKNPDPDDEFL